MGRVLLVDDEGNVLSALRRALRRAFPDGELQIETCDDARRALERVAAMPFDAVVSDYRMPAMNGVAFLKEVRKLQPDAVRLILSASTDFDTLMEALNEAEIFRYIIKPWAEDELIGAVREALARRAQTQEDRRLADEQRLQQGEISAEELERRRLEAEDPGITRVNWGPDGSIRLEDI